MPANLKDRHPDVFNASKRTTRLGITQFCQNEIGLLFGNSGDQVADRYSLLRRRRYKRPRSQGSKASCTPSRSNRVKR